MKSLLLINEESFDLFILRTVLEQQQINSRRFKFRYTLCYVLWRTDQARAQAAIRH